MLDATRRSLLARVLTVTVIYLILKFIGGSMGSMVLYPVTMLVTFLHEFGHAFFGIISGGHVESLSVNRDGSGLTTTLGGSPALIMAGGYLGSAMFGNLLFYIGTKGNARWSQLTLLLLAAFMVIAAVYWFDNFTSSGILLGFAAILSFLALKTTWDKDVLMFLGVATVLYIIQDFNGGPSSDLAQFESRVGIFPAQVWMFIWLGIALVISAFNLRWIFKEARA
jgi:Peptidase M50B-like